MAWYWIVLMLFAAAIVGGVVVFVAIVWQFARGFRW